MMFRSPSRALKLSEADFGASLLSVASSRSLPALSDAIVREVARLIGSRSVGLYAMRDGVPSLLASQAAPAGFLREYDEMAAGGDKLVDQMRDQRRALDGYTEAKATWRRSGVADLLHRWGYGHCMGGPLSAGGDVVAVVFTARPGGDEWFGPSLLRRMDILCAAGSIALEAMMDHGSLSSDPRTWSLSREPSAPIPEGQDHPFLAHLPPRLRDVAALVCQGRTNKEIARELGLYAHTVKEYVGSLCRREHVLNRTQLANRLSPRGGPRARS